MQSLNDVEIRRLREWTEKWRGRPDSDLVGRLLDVNASQAETLESLREALRRVLAPFEREIMTRGATWQDVRDTLALHHPGAGEIADALQAAGRLLDLIANQR